jgi:glycyl-tRNA synthetase
LTKHSEATNTKLVVRQALDQPVVSEVWQADLDRKKAGPRFKGDAKKLEAVILGMNQLQLEECKKKLEEKGQVEFNIEGKPEPLVVDKGLMRVERVTKKETSMTLVQHLLIQVYEYTPNVIEPSFGIGRILYSLIEHVYWPRPEDKQRGVHLN